MSAGGNDAQIEYWNEVSGPKWVAMQEELDAQLRPFQDVLVDWVAAAPGDAVLDVGCGCGATSIAFGEMVGPEGRVLGLDVSAPMLGRARERAEENQSDHIRFEEGDAQSIELDAGAFDFVTSRFGMMFFSDPTVAFRNFKSCLKEGGALTFMCWRSMAENPWMTIPVKAASKHLELPPPPEAFAPGPFALSDRDYVEGLLSDGGFESVEMEGFDSVMKMGHGTDLMEIVDSLVKIGPLTRPLMEANADVVARVKDSIRVAVEPYLGSDGIELGATVWLVRAQ